MLYVYCLFVIEIVEPLQDSKPFVEESLIKVDESSTILFTITRPIISVLFKIEKCLPLFLRAAPESVQPTAAATIAVPQ